MAKYLIPFATSFAVTAMLAVFGIYAGRRIQWAGRISERHIHRKGALRLGGIAMVLAFIFSILADQNLVLTSGLYGFMAAAIVLMLAGARDDVKEIFWKTQLFYQVMVAVLVFAAGIRIYYVADPLGGSIMRLDSGIGIIFSLLLVVIWIVLMINSMNWLDGIDGLSGGVTFIGAMTIFFLSLKPEVNQPPMAILSMILAGTALGFLIFNFHPSFITAGTAGSNFMGFALAALAIFAGTKIATAILVMSVPLIDFLWVIGERIRNKRSIFQPDRNHLHHKLLDLGWSQKKVAAYFYAITILISLVALNTRALGKTVTLVFTAAIMTAALTAINKKIKKLGRAQA